jgi:hypothetical protein
MMPPPTTGLPVEEAYAICGRAATIAFFHVFGRTPDVEEARELAGVRVWTVADDRAVLNRLGLPSELEMTPPLPIAPPPPPAVIETPPRPAPVIEDRTIIETAPPPAPPTSVPHPPSPLRWPKNDDF